MGLRVIQLRTVTMKTIWRASDHQLQDGGWTFYALIGLGQERGLCRKIVFETRVRYQQWPTAAIEIVLVVVVEF